MGDVSIMPTVSAAHLLSGSLILDWIVLFVSALPPIRVVPCLFCFGFDGYPFHSRAVVWTALTHLPVRVTHRRDAPVKPNVYVGLTCLWVVRSDLNPERFVQMANAVYLRNES